jgi:hypothetical protein
MGYITAYKAIRLERNVDYRSVWVNTSPGLKGVPASSANGSGHYDKAPIHAMKLLAAPAGSADAYRLWFYGAIAEDEYVDIPIDAWAVGETIDAYLWKFTIVDSGGNEVTNQDATMFILGLKGKNMPLELS